MKKLDYIFYNNYLKNRKIKDNSILVAKTNKSYLIGPKIDSNFNEHSFYKRMISTSIYNKKIYKKMFKKTVLKLLDKHIEQLESNEVIEIFKNGKTTVHSIIQLPEGMYEKE